MKKNDLSKFKMAAYRPLLSPHPLCGGGDLLFLLRPPAAATCFCSHSKTPTRIISKYPQYANWPWGIGLVIFFLRFLVL